jgi:lambda family phage minor tail protein L
MSRESNHKANSELFSLEPTALLEFFVIYYDYVNMPDEKLYIHGGTNGINGSIYWQGEEYVPFPIQSSGFESKGDGTLPRPKLMVSNQDFFMSNLIRRYSNLAGAKIVRKRVFLKFLDNRNFSEQRNPYGTADANAGLEDQVFFILRKSGENRAVVEFELSSPLELENVTFPKRIVMARYCSFHYRGNGCRYMGAPVANEYDQRLSATMDMRAGILKRKYTNDILPPLAGDPPADVLEDYPDFFVTDLRNSTYVTSSEEVLSDVVVSVATQKCFTEFYGFFKVDRGENGSYSFGIDVDDAAEVYIDGVKVAYKYGTGSMRNENLPSLFSVVASSPNLGVGYHNILIKHYNYLGGNGFDLYYQTGTSLGSASWTKVPNTRYYYDATDSGKLSAGQKFTFDASLNKSVGNDRATLLSAKNELKWKNNGNAYKVGDFVYRETSNIKVSKSDINAVPNWEPLMKVYVCLKNHTSAPNKDPLFNKEYWVADQCSKTLTGCKMRFGNEGSLPFGGFPGTEEYSINGQ